MDWYWWVLIVIVVVAVGALKLRLFSAWMAKRKADEERLIEED